MLLLEDVAATTQIIRTYLAGASPAAVLESVITLAREALERLAAGSFDLVLADLNVPDPKGLDTLDSLARATDGRRRRRGTARCFIGWPP